MTKNIVAARASTTAREIGTKLLIGNFNGIPVVDNNIKLVGIVTAVDKAADKDSLKILRGSDNHYIIPKSRVLTFTGENMRVDFRFNDLLLDYIES